MTARSFAARLIRLVSWLCFEHPWTLSELLIIGAIVLLVLLLLVRLLRRRVAAAVYEDALPERSPIIGVKLAEHKRSWRGIRSLEKGRSAPDGQRAGSRTKPKEITEKVESSKEQVGQLQGEIIGLRQMEARLEQQAADLAAANKQLRDEVTKHRQAEVRLEQRIGKLTAANARLQSQISQQGQPENIPIKDSEQISKPRTQSGPLNTEELSRLAELGKRLAPRRPD